MKRSYCLDTGVFINSWSKNYPIDLFPSVWDHLDKLCRDNTVFVADVVAEELFRQEDDVSQWLRDRSKIIIKKTQDDIFQMKEIVNQYPRLTSEGGTRSGADPWLIAFAFRRKATVVTEEQYSGRLNKPKIPDVCHDLELPHMNTIELLRVTGYRELARS